MTAAAGLAAFATWSAAACSSADHPGGSNDASSDAGNVVDDAPAADAPRDASGYDGGLGLELADVPNTPCAPRGGSLAVVLPGGDAAPASAFQSLRPVGARRVADAMDGAGFVLFDADGRNATVVSTSPLVGGSVAVGDQLVFVGRRSADVIASQRYDAKGIAIGEESTVAVEQAQGVRVGADDQAALVVWGSRTEMRARGIAGGNPAGDGGYDLAVAAKTSAPSFAVSSVKSGLFAVAFSGSDTNAQYQTAFGRGSTTARVGDPSNLFTGLVSRTVVGLARTPSGFALLVTVNDGANPYAMLVLTDAGGRRTSAGLKLEGTLEASAVAVNDSVIGVLAHRREGDAFESKSAVEFRAFDPNGVPRGPWVCLEPPRDGAVVGGGLVAEGNGYAAIFQASDGSASLARFDRLGTGAQ